MKLFPGNQSKKPIIRSIIDDLKARNSITGRTIQIADKGLNCSENIFHAVKNGDGYIFSKSVKQLPEIEKTWVLLTRLFQFKILKNRYSSEDLFEFIRGFRVAKISETKYINLTKSTTFIKELSASTNLPLTSYFLNEGEIKKMLSHRF